MSELMPVILQMVLAVLGSVATMLFSKLSKDIHELTKTVSDLNLKIAVVIEKIEHHEHRLTKLEKEN